MDKLDIIKMMNDLVLRTERGELSWAKTEYAGQYTLLNSNGEIFIAKSNSGDITFTIKGSEGDEVTNETYSSTKDTDLQIYKVSNVLWSLIRDQSSDNKVDFQDILDYLEEDED